MTSPTYLTHTTGGPDRAERTAVAIAWPTGRPISAYTAEELADGVDLCTKAMKARAATNGGCGDA